MTRLTAKVLCIVIIVNGIITLSVGRFSERSEKTESRRKCSQPFREPFCETTIFGVRLDEFKRSKPFSSPETRGYKRPVKLDTWEVSIKHVLNEDST